MAVLQQNANKKLPFGSSLTVPSSNEVATSLSKITISNNYANVNSSVDLGELHPRAPV